MRLTTILLLLSAWTFGQQIPDDYYQFPIRPGQQNYLAGTVGEIRASHFHTGIDVKTYGQIGLPIYAVADGYVSRIKVAPGGYGKVLYMQHPNGTYSVYAHLDEFAKPIKDHILSLQYEKESYSVEDFPKKYQFAFEKGELIAYSGNSGSSSGPHLHFEIRNPSNQPIDVLKLGFDEIKDSRPPVTSKIAFNALDENARVNGYFGRKEFNITNGKLSEPLSLSGKIGIEVYSYDPMNDVSNKNGVTETILLIDDKVVFNEKKEVFSFGQQRNALVHYNYPARAYGSKRFNRLFLADGNNHSMYQVVNRGVELKGDETIRIEMLDSYENKANINVSLTKDVDKPTKVRFPFGVHENHIHFTSKQQASVVINEWKSINAYKKQDGNGYYIWDLRDGLPTHIFKNGETLPSYFVSTIPSNQEMTYVQEEFEASFTNRTLFDTLYLRFEKKYDSVLNREYFHFRNAADPLRTNATVTLKPEKSYDKRAKVFSAFGKRTNFIGGEWTEKGIRFKTRDFTKYTILIDSIPPTVVPKFLSQKEIKIRIADKMSGIKEYRGELNGKFVLLKYEPKQQLLFTDSEDPNIPFKGEFKLTVIDKSNNITNYKNTL